MMSCTVITQNRFDLKLNSKQKSLRFSTSAYQGCFHRVLDQNVIEKIISTLYVTPLLHAIRTGHNECVRALMKTARNFSEVQKRCVNVLAWVVHRENSRDPSSILKILVKAGAEVNYSFQGYSALCHAVQWGYPSGVNTLVELGANVKKTY